MSSPPIEGTFVTIGDLLKVGLIDYEQAVVMAEHAGQEWADAFEQADNWRARANAAWREQASRWERFWHAGVPPYAWTSDWIRERRGW